MGFDSPLNSCRALAWIVTQQSGALGRRSVHHARLRKSQVSRILSSQAVPITASGPLAMKALADRVM